MLSIGPYYTVKLQEKVLFGSNGEGRAFKSVVGVIYILLPVTALLDK